MRMNVASRIVSGMQRRASARLPEVSSMPEAYANRIATAVPVNDVHRFFIDFAASQLSENPRRQVIFRPHGRAGGNRSSIFLLCSLR